MAYNQELAERVRGRLNGLPNVEEKAMIGGLTFMINGKVCIGIVKDELMCRINPDIHEQLITNPGCRTMDFTKRPMIGYVMIDEVGMGTDGKLSKWIELALEFNKIAKASKKKKK